MVGTNSSGLLPPEFSVTSSGPSSRPPTYDGLVSVFASPLVSQALLKPEVGPAGSDLMQPFSQPLTILWLPLVAQMVKNLPAMQETQV